MSLHASGDTLKTSGAIHLKQGEVFIERNAVYNDRWQIYTCSGTRNRMKAVGLIINKYSEAVRELTASKGKKLEAACALDIQFASVAQQMLKKYMEYMVMPPSTDSKVSLLTTLHITLIFHFSDGNNPVAKRNRSPPFGQPLIPLSATTLLLARKKSCTL